MACNTAHAFLPDLRAAVQLPILDVIREVVRELVGKVGENARVGLLATSGTLQARIYEETAKSWAGGLSWVSLPDLDEGDRLQEELVMQSVYGKGGGARGGVKAGFRADPDTGQPYSERIRRASDHLIDAGADVIVLGCTEIPLALEGAPPLSVPTLDPMEVAAETALQIATGDRDLPPIQPESHPVSFER